MSVQYNSQTIRMEVAACGGGRAFQHTQGLEGQYSALDLCFARLDVILYIFSLDDLSNDLRELLGGIRHSITVKRGRGDCHDSLACLRA